MPIHPATYVTSPSVGMAPEAVRRRIRRRWEQRRAETAGRSVAYYPADRYFGSVEKVMTPEEIYTIPARPAYDGKNGHREARPARPRPAAGVAALRVKLVQPR